VRNLLTDAAAPEPGQPTVRIRARNTVGSITVRHAENGE
jgi:hypothetical protein